MMKEDDPYDFDELIAARQAVRDQINALQSELDSLAEAEQE